MLTLSTLAFVLIVITAMIILIFRDWRINSVALALQYLAAFVLINLSWPIGMAVIKLIVGWMATAAIALTCLRYINSDSLTEPNSSLFFRALAGLLVIIVIFILSPLLRDNLFLNVDLIIIQGGLMILGMSLMQLGTNLDPYLITISLLSFLLGFEVIHAALELSTLLTGLLVIVNLGLALVGVYLIVTTSEGLQQENEEEDL